VSNRIPMFMRSGDWSRRVRGGQLWSAAPLGAAFAITWTPCIGPVLAGILALSAATSTEGEGVLLMVLYSLGLALPFLALSLSVPRVHSWLRRFRRGVSSSDVASPRWSASWRSCGASVRPTPLTLRLHNTPTRDHSSTSRPQYRSPALVADPSCTPSRSSARPRTSPPSLAQL